MALLIVGNLMSVNYTISPDGLTMTFNDGVTEILQADVYTYAYYYLIETIVIPTSVTTICGTYIDRYGYTDGAFSITNLLNIIINTPSSLQVIGIGAFFYNIYLTNIEFPIGLQYIGNNAFQYSPYYNNIANISFPSSLQYIGDYAFNPTNVSSFTYYVTTTLGLYPFTAGAIKNVINVIYPPINLLSLGYVSSILLSWTNPSNPYANNPYYVITNTGPPYDTYTISDISNTTLDISGLSVGITRTYTIQTFDQDDISSSIVTFNPATTIGKLPVTIAISGESVQTIITLGTPITPWYVTSVSIPSPYNAPPYPYNPISTPIFVYRNSNGIILPSLPSDSGFYTVYAYINSSEYYLAATSDTYTIFIKIAIPELLDCSPALQLNALSHGGNFSSAITIALGKQMNNTTIAAKVFAQTSAPTCCSTGPVISPFSGGTTSGTQTQALIQNQALCAYNQNLAVAKLRQIPGCPISNDQRFAKYQRFPSPVANCMPPIIVSGLPKALNGPCTNVIGISQTIPPR